MAAHDPASVAIYGYDEYENLAEVGWPFQWISNHLQHRYPDVLSFGEHGSDHRAVAQTAAITPPTNTATAPIPLHPSYRTTNDTLRPFPDPIFYQMAISK